MLHDIVPNLRQYLHRDILILDILPYMLEILQPRLRQVFGVPIIDGPSNDSLDEHRAIHEQRNA